MSLCTFVAIILFDFVVILLFLVIWNVLNDNNKLQKNIPLSSSRGVFFCVYFVYVLRFKIDDNYNIDTQKKMIIAISLNSNYDSYQEELPLDLFLLP